MRLDGWEGAEVTYHRDNFGGLDEECRDCKGAGLVECGDLDVRCDECGGVGYLPVRCRDCGAQAVNASGPTCERCGAEP